VAPAPAATPRAALAAAVDDALARLLPALAAADGPGAAALAASLRQLDAALQRPNGPTAPASAQAERALAALEAAASGDPGTLADLAAVRLVIEGAAQLPQ
jgi:hypothetical protein